MHSYKVQQVSQQLTSLPVIIYMQVSRLCCALPRSSRSPSNDNWTLPVWSLRHRQISPGRLNSCILGLGTVGFHIDTLAGVMALVGCTSLTMTGFLLYPCMQVRFYLLAWPSSQRPYRSGADGPLEGVSEYCTAPLSHQPGG